jgi:hypothetical protein
VKADSNETFDGFVRNAERLFGPDANNTSDSNSSTPTSSGSPSSHSTSPTGSQGSTGGAERTLAVSVSLAFVGFLVILL